MPNPKGVKYKFIYISAVFALLSLLIGPFGSFALIPIFGWKAVCGASPLLLACAFQGWLGQIILKLGWIFLALCLGFLIFGIYRSSPKSKQKSETVHSLSSISDL